MKIISNTIAKLTSGFWGADLFGTELVRYLITIVFNTVSKSNVYRANT